MSQIMTSRKFVFRHGRLKRLLYAAYLALTAILVITTPGLADPNGGRRDSGKGNSQIHFLIGPITKTPDYHGKGGDDKRRGDKLPPAGQPGNQHP
jgi:hypothetical protein